MTTEARIHGIAEMEFIHRDKGGNIISSGRIIGPVTYRRDPDGKPIDIREDEPCPQQ